MADTVAQAELQIIASANTQQILSQFQNLASQIDNVLTQGASKAGNNLGNTLKTVVGGGIETVSNALKVFGSVGVGALGTVLASSISLGVSFNALQQTVTAGLTALLGSKAAADQLTTSIVAFANAEGAFPRDIFFNSAKQLVGFGVEAQKVIPILRSVQDAVSGVGGTGQDISEITNIFAQISSQGKITGIDLERLGLRGINAAQILGDAFGKTAAQVKANAGSIKASSSEIIDALSKGLETQFAGATANLTDTLALATDKFTSAKKLLGSVLVTPFVDPAGGGAAVKILQDINGIIKDVAVNAKPLVDGVIKPLADALQSIADKAKKFVDQLLPMNKALGSPEGIANMQKFIDLVKQFAPLLLLAGGAFTGFTAKLLDGIPVLGTVLQKVLPNFGPLQGSLIAFAIGTPAVREQLIRLGEAIQGALAPALRILSTAFGEVFKSVGGINGPVQTLADTIGNILVKAVQLAGPVFTFLAEQIARIAPLLPAFGAAVVNVFNNIKDAVGPVITGIVNAFNNIKDAIGGISLQDVAGKALGGFGPVGETIAALLPVIEQLGAAIGTLNFGEVFKTVGPQVKALADNLGVLQPLLIGISVASAAAAAGFVVLKAAELAEVVQTQVMTVVHGIATVAEFAMADGTFTLTGALLGLEAATGVVIAPMIVIAAIVAAVAAAFVVLYLKVKPVHDAIDSLISILKPAAFIALSVGIAAIIAAFDLLKPVVISIFNLFKGLFETLVASVKPLVSAFGGLKSALEPVFSFIAANKTVFEVLGAAMLLLLTPIGSIVLAIGALVIILKILPPVINFLATILKDALSISIGIVVDLIKIWTIEIKILIDVLGFVGGVIAAVIGFVVSLAEKIFNITGFVKDAVAAFLNFGPVKDVIDAVTGAIGKVVDAITGFGPVKAIIDGIGSAFNEAGKIIDGITDKLSKVKGFLHTISFGKLFSDSDKKSDQDHVDNVNKGLKSVGDNATVAGQKIQQQFNKAGQDALGGFTTQLKSLNQQLDSAKAAVQTSADSALTSFNPVLQAATAATSANKAVADAQQRQVDIAKQLRDLAAERLKIIRDTISPQDEIAKAQRQLVLDGLNILDIEKQILKAKQDLANLQDPVRIAEEQSAAERNVERAQIAVNAAKQAELDLAKAVNKETIPQVNLAGLTLDQARNKLKAVQSTLAAQKEAATVDANAGKTAQQIADEKRSKQLDTADAQQHLLDAQRAQAALAGDQADKVQAAQENILKLENSKIDAQQTQITEQNHLGDLLKGQTELSTKLKAVDDQITAAKKQQREAAQATAAAITAAKEAELQLRIESDKITGNTEDQARAVQALLGLKSQIPGLDQKVLDKIHEQTSAINDQISKVHALQDAINGIKVNADSEVRQVLTAAHLLGTGQPGTDFSLNAALNAAVNDPKSVVSALLAPGSPFRDALLGILAQQFPGFALGGLIESETFARIGEAGKEVVLPLTRPARMVDLISNPEVLQPILAALPKIVLPSVTVNPTSPSITMNPMAPATIHSGGSYDIEVYRRNERRELAVMIAEEMVNAGAGGTSSITVEAPVHVEQKINEELLAREIERRIMKSIERRLK